jgi:hypothetical protein
MNKIFLSILCSSLFLFTGCETNKVTHITSIFIEAPASASQSMQRTVTLPVSGISIPVMTKELTLAEDLLNTEVVEIGEPGLRIVCLLVQVDRKAAKNIMEVSRHAKGKSFVLVVNDQAVGIMPINDPVIDGNLFFTVEQKGKTNKQAALDLSKDLNTSILAIRKLQE